MSEMVVESAEKLPKAEPIEFSLTADQWTYIQAKLPKGFSLQESKKVQKREKKEPSTKLLEVETQTSAVKDGSQKDLEDAYGDKAKRNRQKKVDRFLEVEPPRPKSKHVLPSERMSDQEMNKCYSVLNQLKKHQSAWPFLEPVDPVKLGILDYPDIVKEPMDLSTVEKNLKNYQYSTSNQFHADINKIWLNSYRYNQKGSDIYRLTTDMEKHYKRITMKTTDQAYPAPVYTKKPPKQKQKPTAPPKAPKPKPNMLHQMTISQKRELCQDIKRLPKQHLSGVWRIVATNKDGPNLELDVEKLQPEKLWRLHAYVREVHTRGTIIKKPEEKKQPHQERHDYPQEEVYSAESSFLIDSDQN